MIYVLRQRKEYHKTDDDGRIDQRVPAIYHMLCIFMGLLLAFNELLTHTLLLHVSISFDLCVTMSRFRGIRVSTRKR